MPTAALAHTLADRLGPDRVFTDSATLALYSADETPRRVLPAAVVFPRHHDDVVALVDFARAHHLPLVARGAGSGNVGGALPVAGGWVVSFECMQRIIEFNPADRLIVVEAGVVTAHIDQAARSHGLFYPPDPGSGAYSRIGGNLAMNAAGPRAVKYGVTRDYVLALKAVDGAGRTLTTGCRTSKGVTGYDLTRLLVGSEGTLALITEATLRLTPAPEAVATLRACFDSQRAATAAVSRIMSQAVLPAALEFMDRHALAAIAPTGAASDLPDGTRALLIIEADGAHTDLPRQTAALSRALQGPGLLELRAARDQTETARLWAARKSLSHAIKRFAPLKINEDVVVPVSRLSEFVDFLDQLAAANDFPIVSFGHAGNGNLHVNLMVHPDDPKEMHAAHRALDRLFDTVLALGGTLSGEHGIGTEKRAWLSREIGPETLAVMQALKHQLDPCGILNPGKLLPDQA
jgi:D-lactate dehydrogenase